ncbi:hypothetical protein KEM52_004912 [Ascosphaera acerosa]|nr:hypothetical protein KEM52_004912 [Ascosphaera acerosa]
MVRPHQGFVTLARCERLEFLNLAYLMKEVEWPIIKRAIRNMPRLSGLVLPSQLMLDSSADLALDLPWPPRLAYLSVGLNFLGSRPEVQVRCGFTWPPTLRHLVVWGHTTPTWLSQFTLLIEPCPTPLASVEVLELLPIPVSLLRSREIELEHLSAVTDTTQDALTLWRTFPGLRSLSVAADICNEDFMHAVLLQPRDSMHLEHLRLLRADAGITFGIETMRAAAGLGANGQVGALHGLRGLWYESRAGRDGVGETVVSSETLQEYDEAFCDAALDADPDCSLPDVGWFRSINLPCAPRTFEYATWDGLHYLSPV